MARFMSGTASSMRASNALMSLMTSFICALIPTPSLDEPGPFRNDSSEAAAFANLCPSAWISHLRDLVKATADSRDVFPLAALGIVNLRSMPISNFWLAYINSIMSIDGDMTWLVVSLMKYNAVDVIHTCILLSKRCCRDKSSSCSSPLVVWNRTISAQLLMAGLRDANLEQST